MRSWQHPFDKRQIGNRPARTKLDAFAQHLANGLTVVQASERMGIYSGDGNAKLQTIRKKLGPQAK